MNIKDLKIVRLLLEYKTGDMQLICLDAYLDKQNNKVEKIEHVDGNTFDVFIVNDATNDKSVLRVFNVIRSEGVKIC
jgi:hypothetical protein